MTAPSTPGESRQRVSDAELAIVLNRAEPACLRADSYKLALDLCDARAAFAKAKARIVEVEGDNLVLSTSESCVVARQLIEHRARADAAEDSIATVRAELLEEAAKIAEQHGFFSSISSDTHLASMIAAAIRALVPAGTSSCAAKDEEASHG